MTILIDTEKAFDKIHVCPMFYDENIQQIRNRRILPQHNKKIYMKSPQLTLYLMGKTKIFFSKIRKEAMMPPLATVVQHSIRS